MSRLAGDTMGKVRNALAATAIAAGLIGGLGAPAPAAASDQILFGVYYEYWACQMYGTQLTTNNTPWHYWNCVYSYYPSDGQYHWYLYLWS
ncbi:hypothetical protein J5X84_14180 [Streptosporangiaceae bacterium NEAU-GS5]|nr:hypothetical protein [Streptosporangiaceae bacterium NEAU-GS5]